MIGQVFDDRYEIKRKLGAGGMAEVYLAHDRHLDRDVALKVLHSNYAQDEQFIERFRREASNAASLNHPNIVQIYDRGEAERTYYIAMEYLDGRSLKDIIVKYAPLRPEHVVSIASQILEALRFAHRKDIIHRDIKPQNIIVDDEGRVKVTDFGIARAGGAARMTETGSILGTAHYFSPEQATGGRVEAASDLYSLGVVMYEMVTAHLPFTGDNAVAIAMQHVNDVPPAPGSLVPGGVPENLEHVIMRALVKDPALRYLTADAFLEDLRKVQGGQPVPPPPSLADEATRVLAPAAAVAAAADRTTVRPAGSGPIGGGGTPAVTPAPPIKRSSAWPWVLVVLFVVALGVGLYLLITSVGGTAATRVDVPDLIGKTQPEAQLLVDDLGLELKVEGTKPSADVGKVVEQDPVSGTKLDEGGTVKVWLGGSDGKVDVPDLTGKTLTQAQVELGLAKLTLAQPISEPSDKPKDTITRQDPAAGARVAEGTTVTVWVSAGPAGGKVEVPNLVGATQDEALAQLEQLKLLGLSTPVDSDRPAGEVVSQSPKPGNQVAEGSTVTFQVSNGPNPTVSVPAVIGLTEGQANAKLVMSGLKGRSTSASGDAPAGTVMDQTPDAGDTVERGSTVEIVISTGPPPTTTTTEPPTPTTTTTT